MVDELYDVRDDGAVDLRVHVQPGAGRTRIQGRYGDAVKVSVGAPPQGGRANKAVGELLAEVFGVKADAVQLIAGETNRAKRFRVSGLEESDVRERLERALDDTGRKPGARDRF